MTQPNTQVYVTGAVREFPLSPERAAAYERQPCDDCGTDIWVSRHGRRLIDTIKTRNLPVVAVCHQCGAARCAMEATGVNPTTPQAVQFGDGDDIEKLLDSWQTNQRRRAKE